MHIYKFSYDSEEDAINSLAKYYEVNSRDIYLKLEQINDLVKEAQDIPYADVGKYTWCIKQILTNKKEKQEFKIRVSYYHHCGTDGSLEWFKDGLLNNFEGLESFVKKLSVICKDIFSEVLIEELRSKLKERFQGEGKGKDAVGVFAFTRLEEAKNDINYDLPEIIRDITDSEVKKKITKELKQNLVSTVVKFYKEYDQHEIDWILFKYWYLVCQKFDKGITSDSDDIGEGRTIPFEQIEEIFYLNE